MKQKIRFIVNPISGANKPIDWKVLIDKHINANKFEHELSFTKARGDATNLANEAAKKNFDIVCVIGGDGTINETAQGLVNTETALAIIPRGSGNGLARHLGIPLNPAKALEFLQEQTLQRMDVGYLNDKLFLCAAGIGFDAEVAYAFDHFGKRGLFSYLYLALKAYLRYRPANYQLTIKGKSVATSALFIAFANASQYGNNTYIAPKADVADGKLNLVIIQPFPFWQSIGVIFRTFTRSLHRSSYVKSYTFDHLTLNSSKHLVHVDGEPLKIEKQIQVSIQPDALKIVY